MAPRVLVSDKLSETAVQIFRDRGIEVDYKPDLGKDKDALLAAIPLYDGLAIRSATKVTSKILEAAKNLKVIGRAGIGAIAQSPAAVAPLATVTVSGTATDNLNLSTSRGNLIYVNAPNPFARVAGNVLGTFGQFVTAATATVASFSGPTNFIGGFTAAICSFWVTDLIAARAAISVSLTSELACWSQAVAFPARVPVASEDRVISTVVFCAAETSAREM